MLSKLFDKFRSSECEPSGSETAPTQVQKTQRLCIVGAGMAGITSAYLLAKIGKYEITVVDKSYPIRGASEQNANTITFIPYPAWTTINYWTVLKDMVTFNSNPASYFKPSLLLDSHFRFWVRTYLKSTSPEKVTQSNTALARLIKYSISLWDGLAEEVTGGDPLKLDYHEEVLTNIYRNLDAKGLKAKEALLKDIQNYEETAKRVTDEELKEYPGASIGFSLAVRCLNTKKYCEYMRDLLEKKYDVEFVSGEVTALNHTEDEIKSIEVTKAYKREVRTIQADRYLLCGGVGSVFLGQKLGLKVPIFGFKGHTLNMYVKDRETPKFTYIYIPENICISRVGYKTTGMVRVSGFADVVGLDTETIPWRKKQLIELAKTFVSETDYDDSKADHWVGLRPVCADDVPIIGKSSKFSNLFWNTGHGARGVTLAAGSATLLAHLMENQPAPGSLDAEHYNPGRFNL